MRPETPKGSPGCRENSRESPLVLIQGVERGHLTFRGCRNPVFVFSLMSQPTSHRVATKTQQLREPAQSTLEGGEASSTLRSRDPKGREDTVALFFLCLPARWPSMQSWKHTAEQDNYSPSFLPGGQNGEPQRSGKDWRDGENDTIRLFLNSWLSLKLQRHGSNLNYNSKT